MSLSASQVDIILTHVRNAILAMPRIRTPKLILVEMMLGETSSRFMHATSLQLHTDWKWICVCVIHFAFSEHPRFVAQFHELIGKAGVTVQSVTEIWGVNLIAEPSIVYL